MLDEDSRTVFPSLHEHNTLNHLRDDALLSPRSVDAESLGRPPSHGLDFNGGWEVGNTLSTSLAELDLILNDPSSNGEIFDNTFRRGNNIRIDADRPQRLPETIDPIMTSAFANNRTCELFGPSNL